MVNIFQEKVSFIWSVADLIRGDYKQSEYGRVILPLTPCRQYGDVQLFSHGHRGKVATMRISLIVLLLFAVVVGCGKNDEEAVNPWDTPTRLALFGLPQEKWARN